MNKDGLMSLARYDAYANNLALDVVAKLSVSDLTDKTSPSHGSVWDLLVHTFTIQAGYLGFCQQETLERPDLSTLVDIRKYQNWLEDNIQSFLSIQSDYDLAQELEIALGVSRFRFTKWQMLLQAFIHATHHRGELSIVLTELGHPLPTLDIIIQFANQSGQPWSWK